MEKCRVYDENTEDDNFLVVNCGPSFRCCKEGCCFHQSVSPNFNVQNLWYLLILAFGMIVAVIVCFCKNKCCQRHTNLRNRRRNRQIQSDQDRSSSQSPEIDVSLVMPPNQSENFSSTQVVLDTARSESTHPETPPPPYGFVVNATFDEHNRIPSYEDVVRGKRSSN